MDTTIYLSQASFLMSHNAATGYLPTLSPKKPITQALATYAKNQVGSVYQQLNHGARALDLRPKLLMNGTIIFHHGNFVEIPISYERLLQDVVRWCTENPEELVLLLPSNLQYEYSAYNDDGSAYVSAMQSVYDQFGITYKHCNDIYDYTVADAMEIASLDSGGYVLALDQQDYYGSFCGKSNWIEDLLVTCYSYPTLDDYGEVQKQISGVRCTESKKNQLQPIQSLKEYVLASANNEATDNNQQLGPPSDTYNFPFNEIQALWQVDNQVVASGMSHFSSLLEDNRRSKVNADVVRWIYDGELDQQSSGISLLAVDNVALHGNALLSVLRTRCSQTDDVICGTDLDMPKLFYVPTTKILYWSVCTALFVFTIVKIWFLWSRHKQKIQADIELVYNSYMLSA